MILIKAIKLTGKRGGVAIVDADKFVEFNQNKWHLDAKGYVQRGVWENGRVRRIFMHRIVNQTPDGSHTDHKNGVRHFNWASNLRIATRSQNSMNAHKYQGLTTSAFKGVSWSAGRSNKWHAEITVDGVRKHLGYFNDEVQAAIAYNRGARELHGAFALLNSVDESLYDSTARAERR